MSVNQRTILGAELAVALAVALLMIATEPQLAIVWDEGYTIGREARLRLWFRALYDPAGFSAHWQPPTVELVQQQGALPPRRDEVDSRSELLFDRRVLAWFWPFAREEPHGHPPFYALVGLVGDLLTPARPALSRARLGPILVFSVTAGALFGFVARRWGSWPASAAAGAWVFQPNLFGQGHYATYDALLSALWLNAILAFAAAVESRGDGESSGHPSRPRWMWVIVFGLLSGCAADTKLTGWFLSLPFFVWTGLFRSRRGLVTLLAGGAVAVVTIYALNPPWWTEPITGVTRFFDSNLTRSETRRIQTLFLGRVVSTPDGSLPWYNTLVWTFLVTPVGFLALSLGGIYRAVHRFRSEPFGPLVVGHWVFLLALRALPHTPGHDGVRQFLPAFGVLALMAGLGAASIVERWGRLGRGLVGAALFEGVVSVALIWPVPLSYFSPLVGGLPGAQFVGMEPTYYWDALSNEALDWLRGHTTRGQKVRFATYPTSWLYLRDQGRLPEGILPSDPGVWAWYVIQNRPGAFSPLDRRIVAKARPAYVVRKCGVPLIWIYPYDQVEALIR
jgi:4-amino-4-deoxy-L-arabinose transferase-like glycosyltransferase